MGPLCRIDRMIETFAGGHSTAWAIAPLRFQQNEACGAINVWFDPMANKIYTYHHIAWCSTLFRYGKDWLVGWLDGQHKVTQLGHGASRMVTSVGWHYN